MSVFSELSPPYGCIVIDPPWQYENKTPTFGAGTRGRAPARGRKGSSAAGHYSTMSNEEIAALPVGDLGAKESALYLWVTNPRMFGHENRRRTVSPIDMVEGWGYRYVTLLTWVKTGPPGMGFAFRGHTEHAIYAVKGRLSIPTGDRRPNVLDDVDVAPVVRSARRGHSEKPPAFFDLVEQVSPGPYVELFCRQPRFGWDSWGYGYEGASGLRVEEWTP